MARKPASDVARCSNTGGPRFQGVRNVLIARLDQLFGGTLTTECMENLVPATQRTSLTEVSYATCSSRKDCMTVAEMVADMSCLDMCCSTTAGRNPRPWAEEWSLKAVRSSPTAEREREGSARNCSACTVYPRHQS